MAPAVHVAEARDEDGRAGRGVGGANPRAASKARRAEVSVSAAWPSSDVAWSRAAR